MLSSKLIKGATLKVIPGAPRGMCSTLRDTINAELLAFLQNSHKQPHDAKATTPPFVIRRVGHSPARRDYLSARNGGIL